MKIENFRKYFGEWFELFKPFLESEEFENIINELRSRTNRGKIIFPYSSTLQAKCINWKNPQNCIFKCFELTPPDKLKVILLGLSPYYTVKNGKPIADGLAFSTQDKDLPPSLNVLYKAIEDDLYPSNSNIIKTPNLSYLAEQGVLLLNIALTCEPQMATIHVDIWKPFIMYFIKLLNEQFSDIHIVMFGEEAQFYKKYINQHSPGGFKFNNHHYLYLENHPAYYARNEANMSTNCFSQIQQLTGNIINWMQIKENKEL